MSEKDLAEHHKVLKQFLAISDDTGSRKPSSTRAARAREKLLKLSSAQFRELSTDVYDELKRRIDESRGEPNYLLPRSTFHPKRNQARQKLSSLPQSRFKDLISDISFEIERRNLHIPSGISPSSDSGENVVEEADSRDDNAEAKTHDRKESINSEKSNTSRGTKRSEASSDNSEPANHSVGMVQSKTVIPTKANMAWSSDEEEDDPSSVKDRSGKLDNDIGIENESEWNRVNAKNLDGSEELNNTVDRDAFENEKNELNSIIASLKEQLAASSSECQELQEKYHALQGDYNKKLTDNKSLYSQIESIRRENDSAPKDREISEDHANLSKEYDTLKSINATLRLENQSLKNRTSKDASSSLSRSNSNSFSKLVSENGVTGIRRDIEEFYDKLSNVDKEFADRSKVSDGDIEDVSKWQKKYEDLLSKRATENLSKNILTSSKFKALKSSVGLISLKLVGDLQAFVETFSSTLGAESVNADLLFDKVSRISMTANEIAHQGDSQVLNSNAYSVCLREAITHAITATRYFSVYNEVLPKVLVQRTIDEVCFAVCDLISVAKLREGTEDIADVSQVILPEEQISSKASFSEDVSVKPLKMANRLKEMHTSTPTSAGNDQNNLSIPRENDLIIQNEPVTKEGTPTKSKTPTETKNIEYSTPTRSDLSSTDNVIDKVTDNGSPSRIEFSPRSKNITALASKFEASASKSPSHINDNSPRAKGPGVSALTSKLSSPENTTKSPSNLGIKKSTIFDRMRKFETSQDDISPASPGRDLNESSKTIPEPASQSDDSLIDNKKNVLLEDRAFQDVEDRAVQSTEDPYDPTPPVKKGFFRSIQDKLTSQYDGDKENGPQSISGELRSANNEQGADEYVPRRAPYSKSARPDEAVVPQASAEDINSTTDTRDFDTKEEKLSNIKSGNAVSHNGNPMSSHLQKDIADDTNLNDVSDVKRQDFNQNNIQEGETERIPDSEVNRSKSFDALNEPSASPEIKKKTVNFGEDVAPSSNRLTDNRETREARERQEARKSMAAATFNVDLFDIDDPDNTLTHVLLYLEHQTIQVISTIQSLLSAIKTPSATRGDLSEKSMAIAEVISQMTEATNTSMNQTRNYQLKEHGSWVVRSLEDCNHRMNALCKPTADKKNSDFADKNFKQRLAGISFDIAKCTKELVKTVEEASLKEDIANLNARLSQEADLT
ncbi:Piso0_005724 [Millerozyma farinosa CBS 7064]|uniref:Piso0_005724 protein n=1 Tax=Pichia sorbitophila (strain ATCC MYA-4447 / BCRC 22081 / CBS 7064 / NBRC 10061 / NRRL Y-12695) TaxID=559304 RepID=G8Y2R4_PICSO|nr:Piso0_005724 [Millerozyma farinosa CBS 7064]